MSTLQRKVSEAILGKEHYVVGSEGDAGGIVARVLRNLGVSNVICIDEKLGNSAYNSFAPGGFLYIETPPKTHSSLIQKGSSYGLRIFVDKPLVYSLDGENSRFPPLYCNFNLESIIHPGATGLIRYCKGNRPGYMHPGDRGVILDLVTHLLGSLSVRQLQSLVVERVLARLEEGTETFARILCNSVLLEAGYGIENFIYAEYPNGKRVTGDWLPESSWADSICRMWTGVSNLEKAMLVAQNIDQIYSKMRG
jgi:hypothetical protein